MEKGCSISPVRGGGGINKNEPNTRSERERVSVLRRGKKRGEGGLENERASERGLVHLNESHR